MFTQEFKDLVLFYSQKPYHYGDIAEATHHVDGTDQLCGDDIQLSICFSEDGIERIGFTGECCAVTKASASLMIKQLEGESLASSMAAIEHFQNFIQTEKLSPEDLNLPEEYILFHQVRQMPSRISCTLLPWDTLKKALREHHSVLEPKTNTHA